MRKFVWKILALALLCASPAYAQGNKDARVSLRITDRTLGEVVDYLRQQSGANIVVLQGKDAKVSLDLTDVAWQDALEIAAEKAGCVVVENKGGILTVEQPPRASWEFPPGSKITEIIDSIAKVGGANVVVSPDVDGTLALRLKNVPWRDALEVAAKTLGYVVVEEERGILRVVDPKSLQAQMETRSYQLRYIRPASQYKPMMKSEFLQPLMVQQQRQGANQDPALTFTVLKALSKALSAGGVMDYIEAQNVIIVRDTAQVQASIAEMLSRLDIEPSQVYVDVKFVSTANRDLLDLGVDYGEAGPTVTLSMSQIPITLPFGEGIPGWEDGIIVNPSDHGPWADPLLNSGNTVIPDTIFGALSFTGVQATLRMLQRDTKTSVFQAPKILALDGREATIFVGETVRWAEAKTEQGQAGGLSLSLEEAPNSPIEVGFQLLIVPHVVPGTNTLTLDVIPKETSLVGTSVSPLAPPGFDVFTVGAQGLTGSIALPRTRSSTIVTSMLLQSGQTAVVGGLATATDINRESRVPYLSAIPIVGELFKYRLKDRDNRNLLVFLTPSIVHTAADSEAILQREIQRRKTELKDQMKELFKAHSGPAADATEATTEESGAGK